MWVGDYHFWLYWGSRAGSLMDVFSFFRRLALIWLAGFPYRTLLPCSFLSFLLPQLQAYV